MSRDMRTITLGRRSKMLHIEAPGCIINIMPGLRDSEGRPVVSVSVQANGDRYAGEQPWWIEGEPGNTQGGARVVEMPAPPTAEEEGAPF